MSHRDTETMKGETLMTELESGRTKSDRRRITRRRFLGAAFGGIVGSLAYTALVEPFWLELVPERLTFPGLPRRLRGIRLVQVSDVHIGHRVSESYLLRSFAQIEALRPEIVVYTGDFITLGPDTPERMIRTFPRFPRGSLATLGVLGNHDYGNAWAEEAWAERIVQLAANSGIRILRNEAVDVHGLQVVGMDDLWAGRCEPAKALRQVDLTRPTVVLSHNPDSLDEGDWRGYESLVLSGHTHGGQCKPPFLPAPLLPVRNRLYTAGRIALPDGRTLYINRGLGYLHQIRFNVRPEVTVFTLA